MYNGLRIRMPAGLVFVLLDRAARSSGPPRTPPRGSPRAISQEGRREVVDTLRELGGLHPRGAQRRLRGPRSADGMQHSSGTSARAVVARCAQAEHVGAKGSPERRAPVVVCPGHDDAPVVGGGGVPVPGEEHGHGDRQPPTGDPAFGYYTQAGNPPGRWIGRGLGGPGVADFQLWEGAR